ncbi:MAG: right-handed parallel beta-helix repeat-containing protein [Microthrixaceae bacterium]|nr:right-handed parallel beta-helix repeat-containing protein [Microthrixaceae bacterium]MCB1011152.1 right-handed parallel beta-helix repeat-containing protein [Microthrixaceae bacterium]
MVTVGGFFRVVACTTVLAGAMVVVPAESAGAVVAIAPTITEDIVDPNDGETSLREAFSLAAGQFGDVQVNLGDDDYELTRCGPATEDLNASGDLDIVGFGTSLTITGTGSITNTCADRGLIQISRAGAVTISGLELSGGQTVSQVMPWTSPSGTTDSVLYGSPVTVMAHDVVLEGLDVHDNTVAGAGAVVAVTTWASALLPDGVVELRDVEIHSNIGGGFHAWSNGMGGVLAVIEDSDISDNITGADHGVPQSWAAGAAVLGFSLVTVSDSVVSGNTVEPVDSSFQTGGLLFAGFGDVEVTGTEIHNNAGGVGGLLATHSTDPLDPTLDIHDTDIRGNLGTLVGGAWIGADLVRASDTTVSLNTQDGDPALPGAGGLAVTGRHLNLERLEVTDNHGQVGGASVWGDEQITLRDSTFEDNDGDRLGGAVLSQNGWDPGAVVVERTRFSRNTTTGAGSTGIGGASISAHGSVSIVDSTVARNSGDALGGLSVSSAIDRALLVRSTLNHNSASGPDGVGALLGGDGDVRLIDTTVTNNTADGVGGVRVGQEADHVGLYHSTITWNTGNVEVTGPARTESWSTVIGVPRPGTSNCVGVVHYNGSANYDTDGTCNWRSGQDVSGGPNPRLGPLRDNGGEVRTRLPDPASPLLDVLSAQSPACGGFAANGVQRDDPNGCDIGAAERP